MVTGQAYVQRATSAGAYRYYVLFLLFLLGVSNYLDRSILNILTQPIKVEFRLTDFEIGVLGGPAFALLYTFLGIPLARLAERGSRVKILTISMVAWSAMTALCGFSANFAQLLLFRIGVGVGEAGAYPSIQSLISDYFPPRRRTTAASLQSFGIAIGGMLGAVIGGVVAEAYGWRAAFLVTGLPGLLIALVIQLTVAEPKHGSMDKNAASAPSSAPSLLTCIRYLLAKKTYVYMVAGAAIANFASIGIAQFGAAYIVRRFGIPLGQLGLISGLAGGISMGLSMLFGGPICDALGRRDVRWYVWIGALTLTLTVPIIYLGYTQTNWFMAIVLIGMPNLFFFVHHPAAIGLSQNLAAPRMRATAVAIYGFASALIGPGLGPVGVGWLSDGLAASSFKGLGRGNYAAICPRGLPLPGASHDLVHLCLSASATGIAEAVILTSALYFVGAAFFLLASISIRRDLGDAMETQSSG